MKKTDNKLRWLSHIVILIAILMVQNLANGQSIGHAYGSYCVGTMNVFYYSGPGSATAWYTDGTIISNNGSSIQVVWNSPTTTAYVNCTYNTGYGYGGTSLYPITISSSVTPSVSISTGSTSICSGSAATFTATPVNGGSSPYYTWYVAGSVVSSGYGNTFTTSSLTNGQQVSCSMSSNASCVTTSTVNSNVITMTVGSPQTLNVTISGNTSVCQGSGTSLSASVSNPVGTLSYQWKKNGVNVSSDVQGPPPYVLVKSTVANGDVFTCVVSSNSCANPGTSNALTISITQPQPFSISTSVNPLGYCPGANVTFTASSSHPGYNYQWSMNGSAVSGATSATFTTTATSVAQLQSVSVSAYTSASCVSNTYATGSAQYIPFTIYAQPTVTGNLTVTSGSSTTLTANGNTPTYRWYDAAGNLIYTGAQYATPTTLASGTYTYQVRGATSDGSCLTNPVTVTLSVDYPAITYSPIYTSSTFTKTIDLSKPVGTVNGTATTTPSGGVTYTIPIYAPPGTNGLEPSVSVVYSSQSGDGNVGYGWNISGMSVISRAGKSIYHNGIVAPVDYTNNDAFVLDGVRLNPVTGTNGANGTIYALEAENFSKIISNTTSSANNPDWFKVIAKDGTVMEFGNTADSRILTDDGQNVILWRLNKIIDINGNYVEFKYNNAYRDSRIDEINYTGNTAAGLSPYDKIKFDYGVRNDKNVIYDAGASLASRVLLKSITVKHDAEVVKTYQFNYGFDNVTSLLKEVIESGSDGTSLNSTIFLYGDQPQNLTTQTTVNLTGPFEYFAGDFDADGKTDLMAATYYYDSQNIKMHSDYRIFTNLTSGSPTTLYTTTLPSGNSVEISDKKTYNFLTGDYNGDGRDDIALVNTGFEYIYPGGTMRTLNNVTVNYTTSSGFSPDNITYPTAIGDNFKFIHSKGNFYIPGDFDGDGNQDYILILARKRTEYDPDPDDYFDYKAFLTSTGTNERNEEILNFGFGANPNPDFYAGTVAAADMITPIDFDGDGKSEVLVVKDGQSYILSISRVSAASGYSFACSVVATTSSIVKDCKVFPGDFNGDKKTDLLVRNTDGSWKILYSDGKSFVNVTFGFNQTVHMTGTYSDDKIIVADFNGDGRSDILHGFVNTSTNSSKFSLYYSKGSSGGFYYEQYDYSGLLGFVDFSVGDFNGDGRSDLINHLCTSCNTDYIAFKAQGQERFLKKVTDGHNVTTSFEYKLLTDKSDPSFYSRTVSLDDPSNKIPFNYVQLPLYAISSLTSPNGIGGTTTTVFNYEDAVLHRAGRGFLGFKKITAKNLANGTSAIAQNDIYTQFAVAYNVKKITALTSTAQVLTQTDFTSSFVNLSTGPLDTRYFQRTDKVLNNDFISGGASENSNTYDNYGNIVTNVLKVGAGSGATVSAVETTTTTTTFGTHNTPIPAKPDQVTVQNIRTGATAQSNTVQYNYNTNGSLAGEVQFYGLPKAITTSYTYDSYGNASSVTTSAAGLTSRTNSFTYDSRGRYPLSKQIAVGTSIAQTETYTYDGKWGKPLSGTTSDCITTQFAYDGYGRLKTTIDPISTTNFSLNWDVQGDNIYYSFTDYAGGEPDTKVWFDKLGRQTKKQVAGFNNQWVTMLTTYDAKGNVQSTTNPYYSSETPITTANSYDAYNRLQTVSNSITTMNYSYTNLAGGNMQVTVTDQSGQTSTKTTDPTGKFVSSSDKGGDLYFSYDSWGNQTEVKHASTTLVTSTYDNYGKQISLVDKNAGTITFSYNAFGELTQQTDNTGHVYQMTYDELGRVISRQGPEGITSYQYFKDNATGCSNNNLTMVTGFNGITKEFTYDNLRREQTEKVTISGTVYTTQYGYDSYNNVNKITYPSGIEVNNTYDNNGQLYQVTGGNPGAQTTLFSGAQMNGFNQFTSYTLGNGKTSSITYQYGFPTQYYTQGVQTLNLNWDYAKATLLSRQDALKGLTESFQFDNLNRLTQTSVNGQTQLNLTYDGTASFSMGNIATKTDAGTYKYKDDKIHAIAYITNPTPYSTSTIGQTVTYTPFLKVASINEDNTNDLLFTYGPDYERVKTEYKVGGTTVETRYFLGDYEKQVDNTGTKEIHYITGGNGICAVIVRQNGVNNFYVAYTDHLGSLLKFTDLNGNIITEQNFDAWGRQRNPNDWTYASIPSVPSWLYRGYTGHEHLSPFGLINMNGRMYDPIQGRMLSPDNYVSSPLNTQGYNRYSYGNNNPLSYTDPDGNNPVIVAVIIGAAIGAYSGGMIANNGQLNPAKWDWNSGRTWGYVFGGALIGAGSGYMGAAVATSGMPFANTAGIVTSSFANSVGMNILTGGGMPVAIGFGFGSYSLQSGKVDYLGKKGNSFMENLGFAFGSLANIQDIFAGVNGITATYKAENPKDDAVHAEMQGEYTDANGNVHKVDISVAESDDWVRPTDMYKYNGDSRFLNTLDYAQYWMHHVIKGGFFLTDPNVRASTLKLYNVNGKWLSTMTENIKKGIGKWGIGKLKYGTTLFGCQSHVAQALWGVGVPTLPINLFPMMLYTQLAIRQAGIYASPFLINH